MVHNKRKILHSWEEFGKDFKVPMRKTCYNTNILGLVYSRIRTESKILPLICKTYNLAYFKHSLF